jgi:hypothetical protein
MADGPYLLFVLCLLDARDRKRGFPVNFSSSIPVATVAQLPLHFRER